jgi:hypothetical protein
MESASTAVTQFNHVPHKSLLFQTDKLSFEILLNKGEEIPYQVMNESGDMGFVLKISDFITGQNLEEGFNH